MTTNLSSIAQNMHSFVELAFHGAGLEGGEQTRVKMDGWQRPIMREIRAN